MVNNDDMVLIYRGLSELLCPSLTHPLTKSVSINTADFFDPASELFVNRSQNLKQHFLR